MFEHGFSDYSELMATARFAHVAERFGVVSDTPTPTL
jgi:hypothetical protein